MTHRGEHNHKSHQIPSASHTPQPERIDDEDMWEGQISETQASGSLSRDLSRRDSRASRRSPDERRASRPSLSYDTPEAYGNLGDVRVEAPVQNPDEDSMRRSSTHYEEGLRPSNHRLSPAASKNSRRSRRLSTTSQVSYDIPDSYQNLDELAVPSPVQNPDESPVHVHHDLEESRSWGSQRGSREPAPRASATADQSVPPVLQDASATVRVSRLATRIFTFSYLILFSILGTLARLGLQWLTTYRDAPVTFSSLWFNFAGSLVMGFLSEDRMLFREEWGTRTYETEIQKAAREKKHDEESSSRSPGHQSGPDLAAARKAYMATKKTIPLYIGLSTGFCGSFTSFSSFIRDVFLALSNDLPNSGAASTGTRNGGYSFMAVLAVIIMTVAMSLSALFVGAHVAIALEPMTPSLPYSLTRKFLDRLAVVLGWGCWLGAVLLAALGPHTWRGEATFALVFAPLGCLARFYISLLLNGKISSFPLGTFAVNVLGTCIIGMAWDLAHVPLGGVIGCHVLQGIEDGFCGCLTTVSTWVAELSSLRRKHAYIYGMASILVSLALLVAIMGGLRWSDGFGALMCSH